MSVTSTPLNRHLVSTLTAAVVILAPALSFSVQPITGKYLLPLMGGTVTTWLSSLIFFQFCVLVGYAAAFATIRLSAKAQVAVVAAIALVSLIVIQMPPNIEAGAASIGALISGLIISLFIPISFLFMLGIVLHEWLGVYRGSIPWYLYALSNLGSIFALLIYPFFIEPGVGLPMQSHVWFILLCVLVALVLYLCWFRWHLDMPSLREQRNSSDPTASAQQVMTWLGLAFLSCLLFMACTRELTAELGSHPLAWVLPLALYLGSFSLTFSGFWSARINLIAGVLFVLFFTAYTYEQGLKINALDNLSIALLLLTNGAGCAFLNGTLYRSRKQEAFAKLYIMIAIGGCLAGIFSTLLAPFIFNRNYEFHLTGILTLILVGCLLIPKNKGLKAALAALLVAPSAWLLNLHASSFSNDRAQAGAPVFNFMRTIYSQNILVTQPTRIAIMSESTLHGSESLNEDSPLSPTTYYHNGSAIGMVFEYLDQAASGEGRDIGVIGLGTGTLAYYGREQDRMVFWDIDPMMMQIAEEFFSYLSTGAATSELRLADGRIGVREIDKQLDLLVVDAFTGDAVPTHLLTLDAFNEYNEVVPTGWIVYHISSRWLDLTSVLEANLEQSERTGIRITTSISSEDNITKDYQSSTYVVVPPADVLENFLEFLRGKAKTNSYLREMNRLPSEENRWSSLLWTDDRHSVTQLLNWTNLLD